MNIEQIMALANIFKEAGLTLLEVIDGETQIKMEKSAPIQPLSPPPGVGEVASDAKTEAGLDFGLREIDEREGENGEYDFSGVSEVISPLAGVFYSSPSPDAKSYVSIGDSVKKGDTLCIIEAMKVMNELAAERDGTVVDICVENEQIVEYGQVIFKIL